MVLRILCLMVISCTQFVAAEVLSEGYFRIEQKGKHAGYLLRRVTRDDKTGDYLLTLYARTKQDDQEVFESYSSRVKHGSGTPIESIHYSTNTGQPLKIHAVFKGDRPQVVFYANKSKKPMRKDTSYKVSLLSSFLFHFADLKKLKTDRNYEYKSFAEERGRTADGTLSLIDSKMVKNIKILHVVDDYLGAPIEHFVTESGEPLAARRPAGDQVIYWVASKEDAVGAFQFPTAEFTQLFGDLPEATKNPWHSVSGFNASEFIKAFTPSEGSRSLSSTGKPRKTEQLPLRKF